MTAPRPLAVLLVEDSPEDAELIVRELRRGGFQPSWERVDTAAALTAALDRQPWELVLADHSMPRFSGGAAFDLVQARGLDVPFIIVSGSIGEAVAVEAMRRGVHDYLLKDSLSRLCPAVERELREAAARTEQRRTQAHLMVADRMASVGTLAAGVAHEINNPLAAIMANLEFASKLLLRQPIDVALVRESMADAAEAARRVRDIVRDLKVFSRPARSDEDGPVDLEHVVESSLRMAQNELRHRAELVRHYEPVAPVLGNESRLGQVVLNLIVNAIQALPEGRVREHQITVSLRPQAGMVALAVEDTGSGIPPEVLPRIFDPFYTTKPVGVGTGLGLAISHRIVSELGGTIDVASQVGKGTTFTVSLPLAGPVVATNPPPPVVTSGLGRARRVLVVDDDSMIGKAVARLLFDEEVDYAASAAAALGHIHAGRRFDVILCDLMMPDRTGMDLHAELGRIAPDQAVRMVFMTGGAFTPAARSFLESVALPRIEKPFSEERLRDVLAQVAPLA